MSGAAFEKKKHEIGWISLMYGCGIGPQVPPGCRSQDHASIRRCQTFQKL
jgi:hypothetical protein